MRTASLADQETYILDDLHSTPRNATLVREVLDEAKKLVDSGKNAKFGCIDKLHQKEVEDRQKVLANGEKLRSISGPEYDLACQVIREAQKIIFMGYNAKISCADAEPDKSEREKRREYYRWKRMNRN